MGNRSVVVYLLISFFMVSGAAWEGHETNPQYEWFEGKDIAIRDDGIYADSNKGLFKLNVVEYGGLHDRYKVLCSYKKKRRLDPSLCQLDRTRKMILARLP